MDNKSLNSKPLVSVVIITYNQQDFILDTLNGVFEQKCEFNYEVILANDCSTDDSDAIIFDFLENHPKRTIVNYTYHKKNKGILNNFNWALFQGNGKYLAICEGDDYWIDNLKLQKQVDYLENNPEFSAVCTNCRIQINITSKSYLFKRSKVNQTFKVDDLLKQRQFHTASLLFKSKYLESFVLPDILSADRFLFLYLASKKPIFYLNEVTCVYRKNEGGISRKVTSINMIKDLNFIEPTKAFLNNNQHHILKTFIYKTIFQYSHQIKLSHYFHIGLKLLFITNFKRSSIELIKKSYSKVSLNVN